MEASSKQVRKKRHVKQGLAEKRKARQGSNGDE